LSDHPSRDVLSALVRGELPMKEARALATHLAEPCFECTGVVEMIRQDLSKGRPGTRELPPEEDAAYDAAIGRAFRVARKVHRAQQRDQTEAARAAGILTQEEGLKAGLKLPRKMEEIARLEALLAKSWSLRHENPSEMVQFAMLAVRHAEKLEVRKHGVERVFDLQGRAYAELGNAYRVLDQYDIAGINLATARKLLALGSGSEHFEIRLLELEASLAADQHRFDLANHNLLRVADFHLHNGHQQLAGRAILSRGLYTGYSGDHDQAILLLQEGLSLIDKECEPRLHYTALHNQLLFLAESGCFREAKAFRLRHSCILSMYAGKTNAAGLRSIEAMIEAGLGNTSSAEIAFRETKRQYEMLGRPYLASLAALNLAAILLAQHRPKEAYEIGEAAAKVFQALRLERDAIAALVVLKTAFRLGRATQKLVKTVADFFHRLQRDPNAKFEIDPE
jgi:tetratricopeptide (TPR) repeat protein